MKCSLDSAVDSTVFPTVHLQSACLSSTTLHVLRKFKYNMIAGRMSQLNIQLNHPCTCGYFGRTFNSVWQYYTNHTITCTSTHGVYTATQHVNVSAAVNESMHAIITGLMANTSYNCCVSVYSELGRSEDVCGSVITGMEMYVLQQLIS